MYTNIVIIAAGGKGNRMQSDLPKQYHLLNGLPIMMHTIRAFEGVANKIIVVLHKDMVDLWHQQCITYGFTARHEITFGGTTRFESVKKGIDYIRTHYPESMTAQTAIAVHDAARPLIMPQLIKKSFELCHQGHGNILGIQSINSVRLGTTESSQGINRDMTWLIQTPQTFPGDVMTKAFEQQEQDNFTDEASVVEKLGYTVTILESDFRNIKITYPSDIHIAQIYLHTFS